MDARLRRELLIRLGPAALADALLELASNEPTVASAVEDLAGTAANASQSAAATAIASPLDAATQEEHARLFTRKLANIKRRTRFYDWEEASEFADELETLLYDLSSHVTDPEQGMLLTASFFEADEDILNLCDDSSGFVSDVFRSDATELFARYAAECANQESAANLLASLYLADEYGVRDELVGVAGRCFGIDGARALIEFFWNQAEIEDSSYRHRCLYAIESLARQVGDAELFERTRLATWPGTPGVAACVDIAEVYLETGSTERALAWLDRVPVDETFQADKRDSLLLVAYGILGRTTEQADVAMRMFRRKRTAISLEDLIAILGEEHRYEVIAGEVEAILAEERFSITDAQFLVDLEKLDEAERYLLDRPEQINGDHYYWLAPLAEDLEDVRPLAATIVYRALLDSILGRGRSQAYGYGVHYLRKLERMATSIEDWGSLSGHEVYAQHLREQHKRKYSFWGRYNG